ncbi:hypothetical protein Anapl_08649 [Anas platyrhynchos]|uniref:Uncharacterized protein n=1 Tax=Anas platyrhynchos TaxID=8839 RepID=R0L2M5_ANAPL|nr:hypothetical protein Anapl_08649 [Anas platyrhynchos]
MNYGPWLRPRSLETETFTDPTQEAKGWQEHKQRRSPTRSREGASQANKLHYHKENFVQLLMPERTAWTGRCLALLKCKLKAGCAEHLSLEKSLWKADGNDVLNHWWAVSGQCDRWRRFPHRTGGHPSPMNRSRSLVSKLEQGSVHRESSLSPCSSLISSARQEEPKSSPNWSATMMWEQYQVSRTEICSFTVQQQYGLQLLRGSPHATRDVSARLYHISPSELPTLLVVKACSCHGLA